MERTKREILAELKDKSPELYSELLTQQERQELEESKCSRQDGGDNEGFRKHQCRGGNCGGGKKWGGYRQGAGRPKTFCERKPITKHVPEESIKKIKEYAAANDISENLAIEKLIDAGYDALKNL
jgi:hypothetical protein